MIQQKQFGVWMDTQQAIIVGKEDIETGELKILARTKGEDVTQNSSEKNENKTPPTCM